MPPTDLMRCICHIANLAAIDYLKAEAKLKRTDYNFNPAAIPEFRVLGQDDLHSNNELEEIAELEAIGAEEKEAAAKDGDARSGSADQKAEEASESRRSKRSAKTATPGILPLRDVPTRWNSKEATIRRILTWPATIKTFCIRYKNESCPQLGDDTFRILELIQPALVVFANLTFTYSEPTANVHLAINDLHDAITELVRMHDHASLIEERQPSYQAAVGKLEKYLYCSDTQYCN
ncbi:hypothetical protein QFC20_007606 [Naganishia adeliensis]|uniref:Uncharacterized protein n=1 Tax=Naganishia adeliensis TaxID=92952 RepID=A0ACC2UXJ3_9TREE|nr:hypothetical protein QFC20_007606 [Naganishia adeliensis]